MASLRLQTMNGEGENWVCGKDDEKKGDE